MLQRSNPTSIAKGISNLSWPVRSQALRSGGGAAVTVENPHPGFPRADRPVLDRRISQAANRVQADGMGGPE